MVHRRCIIFFQNGPIPASFCLFLFRLNTISIIQIEKSIYGVLGIRTQGHRMVGADKTMELWRPPPHDLFGLSLFLTQTIQNVQSIIE